MQILYTVLSILRASHRHIAVAARTRGPSVGHHFCSNHLVINKLKTGKYAIFNALVANTSTVITAYYAHVASIFRYGVLFWENSKTISMCLKRGLNDS